MNSYEFIAKVIRRTRCSMWILLFGGIFHSLGKGVRIYKPRRIEGAGNISIGSNVCIRENVWLNAHGFPKRDCVIKINDNTYIGDDAHIYAINSIIIERDVLIGNRVYISDNLHKYNEITVPISLQGVNKIGDVVLGSGSWIGENVCILGATIGKNCVVGANSVVTRNIPDYSVVAGAPARVIKKYDLKEGRWRNIIRT
ncbi:MAG: acyltransferase [Candidatus Electrothrix sp. GW3-4]|uniref:acyltransferase n=1 Tax=Candidatus Electrothrix sp. GW3-4 TaxID=3126740 RepID=UPI0030CAC4C6